ncbi:MAG TPA: RHS repeat-associated core domain-containing protein, partial [Candidatus Dojkabacteria bacterium]|nr:RHS repeat-associated core domain-containing protein [Candidatus Dojkabacteria bacterium]
RYGFNGKEYDNEFKGAGNLLDYGNRLYDPLAGRFMSVDFFKGMTPSESPYIFGGNSPVSLTDYNGHFKISPYFIKKYPNVSKYLAYVMDQLCGNKEVMNAWITTVGFKDYQQGVTAFKEMVSFGSGPWISMLNSNEDPLIAAGSAWAYDLQRNAGQFHPTWKNNLAISDDNAKDIEAAIAKNDYALVQERMFIMSMLVMHEATHWGMNKYRGFSNHDSRLEDGARFEDNLLGDRLSYREWRNAHGKNFFHPDIAKKYLNSLSAAKSPALNGLILNFSLKTFKSLSTPLGQRGDELLKDNNIKEPFMPNNTYEMPSNKKSNNTYD